MQIHVLGAFFHEIQYLFLPSKLLPESTSVIPVSLFPQEPPLACLGTYNFLVELVTHRVELLELLDNLIFDPNQLGSFRMATSIPHDECLALLPQYHLKYPRKVFLRLHKCQTLGDEFLQRHKHSQLIVFFTRHCAQLGAHTSNLVHTSSTRKEKGLFGSFAASLVSITFAMLPRGNLGVYSLLSVFSLVEIGIGISANPIAFPFYKPKVTLRPEAWPGSGSS